MASITRRPERTEGTEDEKIYRSRIIKLDVGGLQANVGDYAGESIVPMSIGPRITKIQGRLSPAHALQGFDPETGDPLILFFDTKLNDQGGYIRNFGGGLADALSTRMTYDEFLDSVDITQAETGSDTEYNFAEWESVGGPVKLKDKFYGLPIVIGKECVLTKNKVKMNVFTLDADNTDYDPAQLEAFMDAYIATIGESAVVGTKPAERSPQTAEARESRTPHAAVPEPVVQPKPTGRTQAARQPATPARAPVAPPKAPEKTAGRSAPATRTPAVPSRTPATAVPSRVPAKAPVATPARPVRGTPAVSQAPKRDAAEVKAYIEKCIYSNVAVDQIVMNLVKEFDMKQSTAIDCVNAAFDSLAVEADGPAETDLVKVAKTCQSNGFGIPETFEELTQKFPDATKGEKKDAMRLAGLMPK